jgi:sugar lactone lactonase YvrE
MQINEVLSPYAVANGLTLEEDDHTLWLMDGDKCVAAFSTSGAAKKEITEEADKYIARKKEEQWKTR